MRTVAFVPIKLNNERLPGKNTKRFTNGEPLICYILETLQQVNNIDMSYVYCSSETIKPYLPKGIQFLQRDPYLDLSETPFNEVLVSFAELVPSDIYVLTHATAPFISPDSIEKGVAAVQSGLHDSACAVTLLQEFLWEDGSPKNYKPDNIPRTQDLKPLYKETCGLYVYTRDLIINKNRRIGDSPYLVEVSEIEACDINNPDDFVVADAIFQAKKGGFLK